MHLGLRVGPRKENVHTSLLQKRRNYSCLHDHRSKRSCNPALVSLAKVTDILESTRLGKAAVRTMIDLSWERFNLFHSEKAILEGPGAQQSLLAPNTMAHYYRPTPLGCWVLGPFKDTSQLSNLLLFMRELCFFQGEAGEIQCNRSTVVVPLQ